MEAAALNTATSLWPQSDENDNISNCPFRNQHSASPKQLLVSLQNKRLQLCMGPPQDSSGKTRKTSTLAKLANTMLKSDEKSSACKGKGAAGDELGQWKHYLKQTDTITLVSSLTSPCKHLSIGPPGTRPTRGSMCSGCWLHNWHLEHMIESFTHSKVSITERPLWFILLSSLRQFGSMELMPSHCSVNASNCPLQCWMQSSRQCKRSQSAWWKKSCINHVSQTTGHNAVYKVVFFNHWPVKRCFNFFPFALLASVRSTMLYSTLIHCPSLQHLTSMQLWY